MLGILEGIFRIKNKKRNNNKSFTQLSIIFEYSFILKDFIELEF